MARKYYCFCEDDCKFETLTKEQIYSVLEQAISKGQIVDVDSGFITTIKELNHNIGLRFWVGTTAEYNALAEKEDNVLYIKTDDTSVNDLVELFNEVSAKVDELKKSELVNLSNYGVQIPEGADLDKYTATGTYICSGRTSTKDEYGNTKIKAVSIKHCPTANNFKLRVENFVNLENNNAILQEIIDTKGCRYFRVVNEGLGYDVVDLTETGVKWRTAHEVFPKYKMARLENISSGTAHLVTFSWADFFTEKLALATDFHGVGYYPIVKSYTAGLLLGAAHTTKGVEITVYNATAETITSAEIEVTLFNTAAIEDLQGGEYEGAV